MKSTPLITINNAQKRWQGPAWYQAVTLTERIASLHAHIDDTPSHSTIDTAIATQHLQFWKTQRPFEQGKLFAERLAMDSLTEDELLTLLAEPIEAVQQRTFPYPDWLAALTEAFEQPHTSGDVALHLPQETNHPLAAHLSAVKPLVAWGLDSLQTGIQALRQKYAFLPFDLQQIMQTLLINLARHILPKLSKTFVLEMHVARIQERLQGGTSEERFVDFVRQLSQQDGILSLFEEYPVLARQLVICINHWIAYTLEFLDHLCADWKDICSIFTPDNDPGLLVEVRAGVGDLHRRGRSVLVLTFSSGFQLLYKPKSLAIDVHFQELLTWLNTQGASPTFRTMKLIDRGSYGWSEFVHVDSCTSQDEIARFYERQGSYLALLYALDATDFHAENLIAAGEHPILIDLEALFHPRVNGDDLTQPNHLASKTLSQSVARVGLLPHRMWSNEEGIGIDRSGLGGQQGQLSPRPVPKWEAVGTDQMRLVRQRVELPGSQNRPRLNDQDVEVLDYSHSIITGFSRMYQLLKERRDDLIAELLPRFAHDEIRLIVRPTRFYSLLLSESFHPDLLRDALERDRFFDRLWLGIEQRPCLTRVIPAERRDLLRGDVPMFTTYPDSRTIFTTEGEPLFDFFDEPSLELVKKRLQQLDERDLDKQIWFIQASLATILMGTDGLTRKELQVKPAQTQASRERLITAARALGERISKLALCSDYGANWIGITLLKEHTWSLLPANMDLYSGITGIALFLSYLGAVTGEEHYTALAGQALITVQAQIEQQKPYAESMNVGVFDGWGAPIYLFSHLGALWNKLTLFQEAEKLVELLPALIQRDNRLDLLAGSAGCIMSLLSLYAVYPASHILETAIQCGDYLISCAHSMEEGIGWKTIKQETPLAGFSHGTAGIAFSLLKLAEVSGEERFRHTATAALAYERSLFSAEKQNWPDLRLFPDRITSGQDLRATEESSSYMSAWCHGAPGIGLGRLGSLQSMDDELTRQEIDIALKTTIAEGLGRNHSLCHGALGNLELLLAGRQLLHNFQYHEQLEQMTATILDSIDTHGWVTGVPLGVETPGLMTGLAGIGYELLRLAEPERIPSVLLVAPPASPSMSVSV